MARPRVRNNRAVSLTERLPAAASAEYSPSECPATKAASRRTEKPPSVSSTRSVASETAISAGWAFWVSCNASAGPFQMTSVSVSPSAASTSSNTARAAGNRATQERTPMPLYEHVFRARQDSSTQQVEELTGQMTGIVEQLGGKVVKMENWGVRSLTYPMSKNRKAHFVLLNIDGPSAAVAEVERQERISEDVIRYLTVRVDEHEEGPSAMMRKADRDGVRDDRVSGFRGDSESRL